VYARSPAEAATKSRPVDGCGCRGGDERLLRCTSSEPPMTSRLDRTRRCRRASDPSERLAGEELARVRLDPLRARRAPSQLGLATMMPSRRFADPRGPNRHQRPVLSALDPWSHAPTPSARGGRPASPDADRPRTRRPRAQAPSCDARASRGARLDRSIFLRPPDHARRHPLAPSYTVDRPSTLSRQWPERGHDATTARCTTSSSWARAA